MASPRKKVHPKAGQSDRTRRERELLDKNFLALPETDESYDEYPSMEEAGEEGSLTDAEIARSAFPDDFNQSVVLLIAMADAVNLLTTRLIDGWRTINERFIEELHGEGSDYDPHIAELVGVAQIRETLNNIYDMLNDESVVNYDAFIEWLDDTSDG